MKICGWFWWCCHTKVWSKITPFLSLSTNLPLKFLFGQKCPCRHLGVKTWLIAPLLFNEIISFETYSLLRLIFLGIAVVPSKITYGLFWEMFETGGTFAMYSLLCQHTNVGGHARKLSQWSASADSQLSHFHKAWEDKKSNKMRKCLEHHKTAQKVLLFVVMLGTCMLIGDGILTPAISGKYLLPLLLAQYWSKVCEPKTDINVWWT